MMPGLNSPPPSKHDKRCELLGGATVCRCWIRSKPRHPGVESAELWSLKQHPNDQKRLDLYIDYLSELMHTIDHEQEELKKLLRPT